MILLYVFIYEKLYVYVFSKILLGGGDVYKVLKNIFGVEYILM